jgi:hypothetical protein
MDSPRSVILLPHFKEKERIFFWSLECEASFHKLKHLLTDALVLRITDPENDLLVCTYACKEGLGRVLMQEG